MEHASKRSQLRSFGCIVGGLFLAIGAWPIVWSGAEGRTWALAAGSLLVLFGGLRPTMLEPVYRGWMALGHVMGWINTRVVLGLFFYGILTPFGVIARLLGKEFLHVNIVSRAGTYRVRRAIRSVDHVRHQF